MKLINAAIIKWSGESRPLGYNIKYILGGKIDESKKTE